MSSLYCLYCRLSVPEQGGIPQQGLKLLTCQKADGIIALYWSPVISGCVIRNSTEFPYLEEEERRPWGKLRLWQEFIIAFLPIYIDFVPICTCLQRDKHVHFYLDVHVSPQNLSYVRWKVINRCCGYTQEPWVTHDNSKLCRKKWQYSFWYSIWIK